jgi:hypothetical protein
MVLLEAAGPYMRPVLGVSNAMFCLSRFWSRASVTRARSASLHLRRRLLALLAHFFSGIGDRTEGYTATAQIGGRPLKRIRRIKRTLFCALAIALGIGADT